MTLQAGAALMRDSLVWIGDAFHRYNEALKFFITLFLIATGVLVPGVKARVKKWFSDVLKEELKPIQETQRLQALRIEKIQEAHEESRVEVAGISATVNSLERRL